MPNSISISLTTILVCLSAYATTAATPPDTIPASKLYQVSIDSLYHLPPSYHVVGFRAAYYNGTKREVISFLGTALGLPMSIYASRIAIWPRPGDRLSLSDVIVRQGDKLMKWEGKCIILK